MKKRIKQVLALVLAVILAISIRGTSASADGNIPKFDATKDKNVVSFESVKISGSSEKYHENLKFGSSNTWYYSGDIDYGKVDYSKVTNGEMGVYFVLGTVTGAKESGTLLVEHRPASSATRIYIKYSGGELTIAPSNIWRGDLYKKQNYHYDIAYKDGKVSFYVNGSTIAENADVLAACSGKFSAIIPAPGLMAKALPQETTVSNLKLWGDVKKIVVSTINNVTFDNGQKVTFGNGIESASGSYAIGGYTLGEDGEIREVSADMKFQKSAYWAGIGFRCGTILDNEGNKHVCYVTLQQANYNTGLRWMCYADGRADSNLIKFDTYWTENLDLEKTYNIKVSYVDDIFKIAINGNQVLSSAISGLKNGAYADIILDEIGLVLDTGATVSNVKLTGVELEERLNLSTMTNGAVEIQCDDADLSEGSRVVVIPKAAQNYSVAAGSLKYTASKVSHHVNNMDEQAGECVFYMPKENTSLACEFTDSSQQNVAVAAVGAALEYVEEGATEYNGIRFLMRMSLPDTSKDPKGQEVVWNGKAYTLTDYGTLSAKKTDYDANGESAFEKKSAEKLISTTENFADYTVSFRGLTDTDCEYVVKGYLELTPKEGGEPTLIQTELYSGSVASVAAKMQ